jgi:hypothetical protein
MDNLSIVHQGQGVNMNLHEKLIEVRKIVKALKKDTIGKVGYADYPYISTDNILSTIMDKMNELKIILQPSIITGSERDFSYTSAAGKDKTDFITEGKMSFTWINAEEPNDRELVDWYYFGQQDEVSKSLGSGLTYSQRYFLKMYFQIATDEDDPDRRDTSGKTSQQSKPATTVNNTSSHTSEAKPYQTGTQHVLGFGKYKGKTFDEIALTDEKYIHWLADNSTNASIKRDATDWINKPIESAKIDHCPNCGELITSCQCGLPF